MARAGVLHLLAVGIASVLFSLAPRAMAEEPADLSQFAEFDDTSTLRIDYSAFDDILAGTVFEVGLSDRMPGRGPAIVRTGTRIRQENNSRYRYEANRLAMHALKDDHRAVISEYRAELERLPSAIEFSRLSSNQQLAYWLNLHNIVVIDELAARYPIRNLARFRIDGVHFHDAKIIDLDGVRISLNDIRFNIVGANWDDPRVMYGFFSGSVGGPTLQRQAFSGRRVWSQLDASAREFVNALRGVEDARFGYRISPIYGEWRNTMFDTWPDDLTDHLSAFADTGAQSTLSTDAEPHFLRYDWSVADLTNGVGNCRGAGTTDVRLLRGEMGAIPEYPCSTLPRHTRDFMSVVIERRLEFLRSGRLGSVTIRDIETDDEGEPSGRRVDLDGEEISAESSR